MRPPIVFVSSVLFLGGLNAAYPVTNDLATRFDYSDALAELTARGFEEQSELYPRGFWNNMKQWGKPKESGNQGPPPAYSQDPPNYVPTTRLRPVYAEYLRNQGYDVYDPGRIAGSSGKQDPPASSRPSALRPAYAKHLESQGYKLYDPRQGAAGSSTQLDPFPPPASSRPSTLRPAYAKYLERQGYKLYDPRQGAGSSGSQSRRAFYDFD